MRQSRIFAGALLWLGFLFGQVSLHAQPSPSHESGTSRQNESRRAYSLPPEKLKQAIEYSHARNWLALGGAIYGIAALLVVLQWGLSAKFRDWAEAASPRRGVQVILFVPLISLAIDL